MLPAEWLTIILVLTPSDILGFHYPIIHTRETETRIVVIQGGTPFLLLTFQHLEWHESSSNLLNNSNN